MAKHRKKIPVAVKESVRHRQGGKCACCMARGTQYHHILAVCTFDDRSEFAEYNMTQNVVLLCSDHHTLFHVVDLDIVEQVYEYAFWFLKRRIPENMDRLDMMREVVECLESKCTTRFERLCCK